MMIAAAPNFDPLQAAPRRSPRPALAALLLAMFAARPAQAQVIEIDAQGQSHYRTNAGAVEWTEPSSQAMAGSTPPAIPSAALTPVESFPGPPPAFARSMVRAADHAAISPALLEALVWRESHWHPAARSSAGAIGLGQLMPGTARQLGVDARDPHANLLGAALYLRQQLDRFDNNIELALAAYNAGPGRVERARGMPGIAETRAYVAAITGRLSAQAASTASAN